MLGERALRAQDRPAALRWFEMALAKEPDLERAPKVVIIKLKKLVHQTNSPIINCKKSILSFSYFCIEEESMQS